MMTVKRLTWATLCLSPFLFAGTALAWQGRGSAGWAPWSCGWIEGGGWQGWTGMILGTAFWVLVSMAILYLIRRLLQDTRRGRVSLTEGSGPTDILKARYARGEISTEDFQRMKKDLQ